jgi:hypothetical protein
MTTAITLLVREEQIMGLPTDLPLVGWTRDRGTIFRGNALMTLAQPTLLTRG